MKQEGTTKHVIPPDDAITTGLAQVVLGDSCLGRWILDRD